MTSNDKGIGRRIELTPLSADAWEARKPPAPEKLVDALHYKVHYDVGRGRTARTLRNKHDEAKDSSYHRMTNYPSLSIKECVRAAHKLARRNGFVPKGMKTPILTDDDVEMYQDGTFMVPLHYRKKPGNLSSMLDSVPDILLSFFFTFRERKDNKVILKTISCSHALSGHDFFTVNRRFIRTDWMNYPSYRSDVEYVTSKAFGLSARKFNCYLNTTLNWWKMYSYP